MAVPPELVAKYPSLQKFVDQGANYKEWKDGRETALLQYIKQRPDHAQLQNNPQRVLDAMDEFAAQQDFLINIGSDKGPKILEIVAQKRPGVVVELGGYVGYSAIMFANQIRQNSAGHDGDPGHVWSLEFEPEFARIAEEMIALSGLTELVTVVIGSAEASLRRLTVAGELSKIDLLFLDHVEQLYLPDLKLCETLDLFRPGSYIVADNVVCPGAPDYRQYVRSHPRLRTRAIKGLIMPGEMADEIDISEVIS